MSINVAVDMRKGSDFTSALQREVHVILRALLKKALLTKRYWSERT
jgi:hypothetical protein